MKVVEQSMSGAVGTFEAEQVGTSVPGKQSIRDLILQGAAQAFLQKGYQKASMDEIARAAGVARRSLYHHFSSKQEILEAVCIEQAKYFLKRVKNEVPPQEDFPRYLCDCLFYVIKHSSQSPMFMLKAARGAELDPVAFYFSSERLIDEWVELFQQPYIDALRKHQINPQIQLTRLVNWFGRISTSYLQYPLAGESDEDILESLRLFVENALRFQPDQSTTDPKS